MMECKSMKEFEKVAQFCVDALRREVSKTKPLSKLIRARLLQTPDLTSRKDRIAWYKSWAKKRHERFWKPPPKAKAKKS